MNSNIPLVSVLINNYNKGVYLKKCLKSISNQSYENIEVIFWDDNSTDNSRSIFFEWCSTLDENSNIKIRNYTTCKELNLCWNKCIPLGVTRWAALLKCTGDYVAILDSDDWWTKDKLSLQVAAMPKWAAVSFTDCEIVDEMNQFIGETFHDRYPVPNRTYISPMYHYKSLLTDYNYMPASTLLFDRKKLMKSIKSLPPTHYTSGEDYDWLLKVAANYGCFYHAKPLTYYTVVRDSLTHDKRSSTRATWYEIDAAVSSYNRTGKFKWKFRKHLIWLYCKLIWKQFIREKL